MTRTVLAALGCLFVLALGGCGEPETVRNGNTSSTPARNASPANNGVPGQASIDPNTSANTAENPVAATRNRKRDEMRQTAGDPPANYDIEEMLKRSTRPAPENSTFAVAMANVVVERRIFLNHPILAKVEKVTDGARSTLKVETTDGRTLDLRPNAVEALSVASSAVIMQAAGLQMPRSKPMDRKPGAANRN